MRKKSILLVWIFYFLSMQKIYFWIIIPMIICIVGLGIFLGWWKEKKIHTIVTPPPSTVTGGVTSMTGRLTLSGTELIDESGQSIVLRGYNWWGYNPGMTEPEDAPDIAAMWANVVRIPLRWRFAEDSKQDQYSPEEAGYIKESGLKILDEQISEATRAGLWVILFIGSDIDWNNTWEIEEFWVVWETLANRYKDTPSIAGYEILSEPHPPEPYSNSDVKAFYLKNIQSIRAIDIKTPIIIWPAKATDCTDGPYDIRCLEKIYLWNLDQVFYTFNFYEPPQYVKWKGDTKEKNADFQAYPWVFYNPKTKQNFTLDAIWIKNILTLGKEFSEKYQVPVFVNQIWVSSIAPGSMEYTRDTLSMLNEYSIGYTWWKYRAAYTKNSLLSWDRGILWEDKEGNWYRKEDWIELMSELFKE